MNFELDEGQRIIRDSVARYLESEYTFERRRRHLGAPDGFEPALWRDFAELGWIGAGWPEAIGGLGGGPEEVALVAEQLGRHLVVSPYLPGAVLAASTVLAAGADEQQSTLLSPMAAGESLIVPAFTEARARHNPHHIETRARSEGGGFVLDGHKCLVPFAAAADRFVVSARTAGEVGEVGGIGLFVVDAGASGVECVHVRTQDGGQASDVRFRSVSVPADGVLGAPGDGASALGHGLDAAAAAACAEACGAMWAVYERTLDYLKIREQFGTTLGSFQALQHRIVDVWMHCQLSSSMSIAATIAMRDAPATERARAVSAAKHKIAASARHVGQEGIQLHGGIGMTEEYPIGHYLKRLTAINQSFGDASHHLERFRALSR